MRAQPPANRETVFAGEREIEHQHIERVALQRAVKLRRIRGDAHRESALARDGHPRDEEVPEPAVELPGELVELLVPKLDGEPRLPPDLPREVDVEPLEVALLVLVLEGVERRLRQDDELPALLRCTKRRRQVGVPALALAPLAGRKHGDEQGAGERGPHARRIPAGPA